MRFVNLPEQSITGVVVNGPSENLGTLVPAGWRQLATSLLNPGANLPSDAVFSEFSTELPDGRYREVLGLLQATRSGDPSHETVPIPAGTWISADHVGPEAMIAGAFKEMLDWMAARDLSPSGEKLDTGYRLDGPPVRHTLYVRLGSIAETGSSQTGFVATR